MKVFSLFLILCVAFGALMAQENSGEIKVRITREMDGQLQTFERTYRNDKEMRSDPDFQAFMKKGQEPFPLDEDFWDASHWEPTEDDAYHYYDLGEPYSPPHHFRMTFHNDSLKQVFEREFRKFSDQVAMMENAIHRQLRQWNKEGWYWESPQWSRSQAPEPLNPFEEPDSRIQISEDITEMGKRAVVKPADQLVLEDLTFNPAPGESQFKMRFSLPEQGELNIRLYNGDGLEVFSRYFPRTSGFYGEFIDLSGQLAGDYLLEVSLNGKRLTRKVTIN